MAYDMLFPVPDGTMYVASCHMPRLKSARLERDNRVKDGVTGEQPSFAPLDIPLKRTYTSSIVDALYELIQNLEFPPGMRLTEVALARRFGVSKTPIREALMLLEKEGLVTIVPHAGATVTWLSLEDYGQQLFIQDALEVPALQLVAARITTAEAATCGQLVSEIGKMRAARDALRYQQLVIRLHRELFAVARNPRLTSLINSVQRSLRRYHPVFVRPFLENWDREYDIVARRFLHLRSGDPAAAVGVVEQGHAAMLAFARDRVLAQDPAIMPYLNVDRLGEEHAASGYGSDEMEIARVPSSPTARR
jgi:DNA-binding GntR family transcriptional regulator